MGLVFDLTVAVIGGLALLAILAWVAISVLDANNDELPGIVETLTGARRRRLAANADAPPSPEPPSDP